MCNVKGFEAEMWGHGVHEVHTKRTMWNENSSCSLCFLRAHRDLAGHGVPEVHTKDTII